MNSLERDYFKGIILGQLAEYFGDPIMRKKLSEPSEQPAELLERATVEAERELFLALRKKSDGHIMELRNALDRIKNETYGICLDCDDEIPAKRLMAQPTTRLCVTCQEAKEREQRLRKGAV